MLNRKCIRATKQMQERQVIRDVDIEKEKKKKGGWGLPKDANVLAKRSGANVVLLNPHKKRN